MQASPMLRRTAMSGGLGVGTAGLLTGVLLFGPLATTLLIAVVFVLAWPLAATVKYLADDAPFQSPVVVALAAAAGVLGLPGLIRLLAWGALGLALALVFAGLFILLDRLFPGGRRERRGRRGGTRGRSKPAYEGLVRLSQADEGEDEKLIASLQCPLSIEELCEVWCETNTSLQRGGDLRERQAVAEVRRICLDEFERRNPEGFHRWIEAGAADNPGTFLLPKPGE